MFVCGQNVSAAKKKNNEHKYFRINAVVQSRVKHTGKELRDDRSREDFPQAMNTQCIRSFASLYQEQRVKFIPEPYPAPRLQKFIPNIEVSHHQNRDFLEKEGGSGELFFSFDLSTEAI